MRAGDRLYESGYLTHGIVLEWLVNDTELPDVC
ncbi:hypothetical protein JOC58_002890 [Paenibacillus hunanensis]|uniref:Uncharacterized protein n=1 Tax=Paenibacillus hunanensis TaxID=539262 RepID=A0ABU1J323_9BACL|nr:hypothetical protein [Paenibacillus hunanensis]